MVEQGPRPSESAEILDTNNYAGLYGRLLLASQAPESEVNKFINPVTEIPAETLPTTISPERNFNPITQRLSKDERVAAWKGKDFDDAYKEWRKKLTNSIKDAKGDKRIETVALIAGKAASEFKAEDTDRLYDRFCKGKSDTTDFAKAVVTSLQKDGKVDLEKITSLSSDIEWLSGNLFGKHTAVAVSRIIELEAEIANNPKEAIIQKLFADKERINKLKQDEKDLLKLLHDGLSKEAPDQPADTRPEPDTASKKQKEEVKFRNPLTPQLREVVRRYRNLGEAAVPPEINNNLRRQLRLNDFTAKEIEYYKDHPDELMRELDKRMAQEDEKQSKPKSTEADITDQPDTVSQRPAAARLEPTQQEKSTGINKRPRTRLRVRPVTGIDLITNNDDGKIYTVVRRVKKDPTHDEQIIIQDPDGKTTAYSKRWLEKQIEEQGTPWDVFEPVGSAGPAEQTKVEDEEDFSPAPLRNI